jgi:Spy/CpxP family protein refolding chaperone
MSLVSGTTRRIFLLPLLAIGIHPQGPPFNGPGGPPHGNPEGGRRPGPSRGGALADVRGKWWTNSFIIHRLALSNDQQREIENVFQQNRIKLIDLTAALQKEEALLDPLLLADHLQESRILAQIDRVADARAALEKANARMLYAFRTLLTSEQWRELQYSADDSYAPPDRQSPGRPGRK